MRSIGQSTVQCQKQNGTFRGSSSSVASRRASARHDAATTLERVYSLRQACCMVCVWGSAGWGARMKRRVGEATCRHAHQKGTRGTSGARRKV
jgi:hypothetical protein